MRGPSTSSWLAAIEARGSAHPAPGSASLAAHGRSGRAAGAAAGNSGVICAARPAMPSPASFSCGEALRRAAPGLENGLRRAVRPSGPRRRPIGALVTCGLRNIGEWRAISRTAAARRRRAIDQQPTLPEAAAEAPANVRNNVVWAAAPLFRAGTAPRPAPSTAKGRWPTRWPEADDDRAPRAAWGRPPLP